MSKTEVIIGVVIDLVSVVVIVISIPLFVFGMLSFFGLL